MAKAHICMLTLEHPPNDDRIFEKEARSLRDAGYQVSILCKADPDGRVRSFIGRQVINPDAALDFDLDGIPVSAVKADGRPVGRLLHKVQSDRFSRAFIRKALEINADAYHAHEPVSFYLGLLITRKNGKKLIFDSHESWIGGSRKEQMIKRLYLRELKYLITANSISRGHLLGLNPALQTEIIYNFPDPRVFNLPFNEKKLERITLAHDGILLFNRGLKTMAEVMRMLKKSHPELRLKIVGEGGEAETRFLEKIRNEGVDNIEVSGWLPYRQVPKALHDCSIGLIMKTRLPLNNVLGGPSIKLFNYFASGMAVIDVNLPESSFFLNQSRSGVSVRVPTAENIYHALIRLVEDPELLKTYCKRSFEWSRKWQWPSEAKKLNAFYEEVVFNEKPWIFR